MLPICGVTTQPASDTTHTGHMLLCLVWWHSAARHHGKMLYACMTDLEDMCSTGAPIP